MARKSKSTVVKESKNRFRLLRFKEEDDIKGEPSLTTDDMVEITGLSKGLIGKLEKADLDANQAPPCNASTVKILHDTLNVSYEYLMGETTSKQNRTIQTSNPILSNLNDEFWNHLSEALTDEWSKEKTYDSERITILRMLLSSPKDFGYFLDAIYEYLYQIYKHNNKVGLDPNSHIVMDSLGQYEYSFNRYMDHFLTDKIYPNMDIVLEEHHKMVETTQPLNDKIFNELMSDFTDFLKK